MEKQKKISQYDYLNAIKPFEPYIREADIRLRTDEYIILHFDGVDMTRKHLRRMNSSEKEVFSDCLLQTTKKLCEYFKGTRLAYTCNDEISLLLAGSDIEKNHHNRIQKLTSIASAKASIELLLCLQQNEKFEILKEMQSSCMFAVKCYNLPQCLVNDYFKTRLLSCKKSTFDRHENFEEKAKWEKFGFLITQQSSVWIEESVDFSHMKLTKKPQDEFYTLNKIR